MHFTLVSHSAHLTPGDVSAIAEALQIQLRRDACPAWERVVPDITIAAEAPTGSVPLLLLDSPEKDDPASALGYHDDKSTPAIRCFVEPVLAGGGGVLDGGSSGVSFASVVSHEILETLIDPSVNLWADAMATIGDQTFTQISLEIADPVQGSLVPIVLDNGQTVALSDFVYPNFFDAGSTGPWDHLEGLEAPLTLAAGGYLVGRTGGPGTEKDAFAETPPPAWRVALNLRASSRWRKRQAR